MQFKQVSLRVLISVAMLVIASIVTAQNITLKGKIIDNSDKAELSGATITLALQKDSSQKQLRVSDATGNFQFTNIYAAAYVVKITMSGYEKTEQKINLQASNKEAISFVLNKLATNLTGVTVVATAPPVKQKGDTSEFSANQFKVNPDATAEDLIKKLPGITVAKDGTVTALGEQVRKVTVDGRDFFGDDATAALRNLPAEIIDKIQVFDRLSDQAQLTGFDDGNSIKTVNIVTKTGVRNGQLGRMFAGAGTDGRYTGGGNVSFFKGNRRLSVVGNFNNINQQNFSGQDLLGVSNAGGNNNNRGGSGGSNRGGNQDNFTVPQANGINKTNALGLNFSNQYGKKLTISGSYFFNNSNNSNQSNTTTQTFFTPKNQFSQQQLSTATNNTNHRLNARFEYKIDSFNAVFVIPTVSFQKNNSRSINAAQNFYAVNDSISTSASNIINRRDGFNIRNTIIFRHQFKKQGRTFSISVNTGWSANNGETTTNATYKFYNGLLATDSVQNRFSDNETKGANYSVGFAYTEPLSKKAQIQFEYTPAVQKNNANQQTFNYDGVKYSVFDNTLSNKFENTITTNNGGVSYRFAKSRDEQLSFGLNAQHSKLESDRVYPTATRVNQTFANLLPNAMYRKKIGKYSNVRVFYRASTTFPSINQLQDVVNLNNPLRVSSGNPNLKQSYTNFLSGRYSYTNTKNSKSFFANLILQTAADFISSGTFVARNGDSTIQNGIVLKRGSQLTKPVNLDGYKTIRTFFTYSMPLKFIKTTVNLNAGYSYNRLPGFINNKNTITNSYAYNTGVVFGSNISEFVDFNISYNANFNNSNTTNTTGTSTRFVNQAAGLQLNLLNKKGWFIQNDVFGNKFSGLSAGFNQSFWLWNAAIGKKILKKQAGELKLSVFDLLKQNQSLVRTVTGTYIEDAQTQVLQQYFMLTFTYKLKNFGTPARQSNGDGNRQRGFGMGGFGQDRF
jgi:hypothetical protein